MDNLRAKPIYKLTLSAMFTALITLCSWISVPTEVPFTLQTMGVFLAAGLLEWKYSILSVTVYLLLGLVGVPVYAGFTSGAGILFGITGGYFMGFIFTALVIGLITKKFGKSFVVLVVSIVLGLGVCYAFGTLWFMFSTGSDVVSALMLCVVPYLLFDGVKIAVSVILVNRLDKHV